MGSKGALQALILAPLVLGVIVLGLFLVSIMPLIFLKVHLIQTITFEYRYSNAQLALNTLLSLSRVDSLDGNAKTASKIVAEYVTMDARTLDGRKPDISFLKSDLDSMARYKIFECYSLTAGSISLAASDCKPESKTESYSASLPISTPNVVTTLKLTVG